MRLSTDQVQDDGSIARLAIVRTLLIQVLVMLAVSAAAIGYLNWSSSVAKADFMKANELSLSELKREPPTSTPMQTAKAPMACYRRA
jgi:hypothetical protein